jgi:hypothetical protein
MRIVPVPGDPIRLLPPSQCYFKGESCNQLHLKLFHFVDLGTSANSFLEACGTKGEPPVEEIALVLLRDPREFFRLAEDRDK